MLTCAVLETDAATVVVDQSRLEPSVVQFAPFEVLGGTHGADLRTGTRRFFQFEYRLRLIAENQFGKDVALPETKLSYRVQSRVGQGTALQGRDQTYLLPAQSMRVLSLVPTDATDIRDASAETFSDLDQRAFRANLFVVVGGVLFVARRARRAARAGPARPRYRKPATAAERLMIRMPPSCAASAASSGPSRASGPDTGWTTGAGRPRAGRRPHRRHVRDRPARELHAGGRGRHHGRRPPHPEDRLAAREAARDFRVGHRPGVAARLRAHGRRRSAERASRDACSKALGQALTVLTAAQYGRDAALDDAALDETLATGSQLMRRMMFEQTWLMKRLAAWRAGTEVDNRAWSR